MKKLSSQEKKEILADGKNKNRMLNFRKVKEDGVKYYAKKMSFEKYLSWLEQMQKLNPVKPRKKFVVYKTVKI